MNTRTPFHRALCIGMIVAILTGIGSVQAQIRINEVLASNDAILADEDGDYPDWIELQNTGTSEINLSGYGITDDPEEPYKYTFQEVVVLPGDYALLFASDKNKHGDHLFNETVVRAGDSTKYLIPRSSQPESWIESGYTDLLWDDGVFGIGYGDSDDATTVPEGTISVFTRTTFTLERTDDIEKIFFHIDFDDGFIAYLNGIEIARENMSEAAPAPYNATATIYTEPQMVYGNPPFAYAIDNIDELLTTGENVLAIQLHNNNANSSDLTLIPFLTIGRTAAPPESRGVAEETGLQEEVIVHPHLNFKLSSDGETVVLTKPDESLADSIRYPDLLADESYGRVGDGNNWLIFSDPTPLQPNGENGYDERLPEPVLTQKSGLFSENINLSLENQEYADHIYFTTDGSEPSTDDQLFGTEARTISSSSTLRFRNIEEGKLPSNVVTHTYVIGESHDLPIVSVSTHPDNLWSDESGIYVVGTNGIEGNCSNGPVNWNQDWEIPINIELIETDGTSAFNTGAGAKIYGACSRTNSQKSLSVFFRNEYGVNELEYKLFESKEIDRFEALVLRNSGNDFTGQNHTQFRDGLMTGLISDTEVLTQAFRPVVVYLNGEYWGIHNIREKINEHFIESNSDADSENIDLLEKDGWIIHGTDEKYRELITYLQSNNLSDSAAYLQIEEYIDINSYIDYMASQIYFANTDWPGNNVKFWRSRTEKGKFKWIVYDTDFGFGLSYGGQVDHNTLTFALDANGPPDWPNPPWSTFIFRKLTDSDIFVEKFVTRMADFMNTRFMPNSVITRINEIAGHIESEVPLHVERWGNNVTSWENDVNKLRNFARNRPNHVRNFFKSQFQLSDMQNLVVQVNDSTYGAVMVNRVKPDAYPWEGSYWGNIRVKLIAEPNQGYVFKEWQGSVQSKEVEINIMPGSTVTAVFEAASQAEANIVINEIMYNASDEADSDDWVELLNAGETEVDLSGWILKDDDDTHSFTIPEGTVVAPQDFLVISHSVSDFESFHPNVPVIGEMDFGLSGGGDQVRLFDNNGFLVDSLEYDDKDPWPLEADGDGYTLELTNSDSDNSLAENWEASFDTGGSPGAQNSSVLSLENPGESVPKEVKLYSNYPNPFNPLTNISFDLPEAGRTSLRIYDVLGRHVAHLINERLAAGRHTVTFNAEGLSSGVYLYRLETGSASYIGKMLLVK